MNQLIHLLPEENHLGSISQFSKVRCSGTIAADDGNFYRFYSNSSTQVKMKKLGLIVKPHKFSVGDKVKFKLRARTDYPGQIEVYDVVFISNLRRNLLLSDIERKGICEGYLKREGEKWVVKEANNYVIINVQISAWEIDTFSVYEARLNQLVKFKMTESRKSDKLIAILIDRKFSSEYLQMISLQSSSSHTQAAIIGSNDKGFFTTLFNGKIEAFLPLKEGFERDNSNYQIVEVGNFVNVYIDKIFRSHKTVNLVLKDEN